MWLNKARMKNLKMKKSFFQSQMKPENSWMSFYSLKCVFNQKLSMNATELKKIFETWQRRSFDSSKCDEELPADFVSLCENQKWHKEDNYESKLFILIKEVHMRISTQKVPNFNFDYKQLFKTLRPFFATISN